MPVGWLRQIITKANDGLGDGLNQFGVRGGYVLVSGIGVSLGQRETAPVSNRSRQLMTRQLTNSFGLPSGAQRGAVTDVERLERANAFRSGWSAC